MLNHSRVARWCKVICSQWLIVHMVVFATECRKFPARSKAALRPRRAANMSRSTRPSVIAATTGAKMAPRIAIVTSAANTTRIDGRHAIAIAQAKRAMTPIMIRHKAALDLGCVDQGSDGSVHRDPDQAADRQNQTDGGLVPPCLREEEHADMRPQPAPHIGQQAIQPIQPIQRLMMGHAHSLTGGHGLGTPLTNMG
jgi:hypothetical protein